jgi:hypothetical protein
MEVFRMIGIGTVLLVSYLVVAGLSGHTSTSSPGVAAGKNGKVTIAAYNWTKGGFDSVMMLDFTVRNDNDYAIKDVTIRCEHSAKSGTNIVSNTRTIYERVPAHGALSKSKFNMGFIHSQIDTSSCRVTDYVQLS